VVPVLDALRGVAILAVFAQHLGDRFLPFVADRVEEAVPPALAPWILTVLHHAWWGVDLFFVLSGYSLAQGYVRAFERGRAPSARSFFVRRAARILPAFLVAVAVVLAVRPWTASLPGFGASLAVHLLLLQGYLVPGGIVLIGAAWSLTTEAHFYLLLPALARPLLDPARGLSRFAVGALLCVAVWLTRGALHHAFLEPGVRTALLEASQRRWIVSRLDQFVLGALAAAAAVAIDRSRSAQSAHRLAPAALGASVVALVVAFRLEGQGYLTPGGSWPYALLSLATAALVLAATLLDGLGQRLASPLPLRAIGIVSYGVFLHHQLALGLAGHWLPGPPGWGSLAGTAALGLALSLAMGLASWVLVERPAIAWARRR
jgi:peptidoglycan/LPS O-acetylase OafA/YrhL